MNDAQERDLVRVLDLQTAALTELTSAMRARREAFLAVRPDRTLERTEELEALTQRATDAERRRGEVTHRIFLDHGLDRRGRWKDLVRKLPGQQAARVGAAIERARAAARELRIEGAVGADLLAMSSRAHEGIVRRLISSSAEGPGIYDQRSRAVTMNKGSGRLIDGRV